MDRMENGNGRGAGDEIEARVWIERAIRAYGKLIYRKPVELPEEVPEKIRSYETGGKFYQMDVGDYEALAELMDARKRKSMEMGEGLLAYHQDGALVTYSRYIDRSSVFLRIYDFDQLLDLREVLTTINQMDDDVIADIRKGLREKKNRYTFWNETEHDQESPD